MSPNEEYVLSVLQKHYGGEIIEGEDPPDAYLIFGDRKIAVEVTRLVEQVVDESGNRVSRMAHDIPALEFADDLNRVMHSMLPEVIQVLVIVPSPLNNIRRTKEQVQSLIKKMIEERRDQVDITIEKNLISISIYNIARPSGEKVIGAVSNRYSDANIGKNTDFLLSDRISSKAKKCSNMPGISEYWLALYNHYWVADYESYKTSYDRLKIKHSFNKILIVDGYGQAQQL